MVHGIGNSRKSRNNTIGSIVAVIRMGVGVTVHVVMSEKSNHFPLLFNTP